jgi:PPOX class probable F420-dependent enzyme
MLVALNLRTDGVSALRACRQCATSLSAGENRQSRRHAMVDDKLRALGEERVQDFLKLARVARLATSDHSGVPHNIPICFRFDEVTHFYFVIDEKPKRLTGSRLKRMRNIAENPGVALIIDRYEEEWSYPDYVLIHGQAHVVENPNEYMLAQRNLRDKYRNIERWY